MAIDPRDYGAVGDGVSDDTAALQAAIDAAAAAGGAVVDGRGLIFRLTATIRFHGSGNTFRNIHIDASDANAGAKLSGVRL